MSQNMKAIPLVGGPRDGTLLPYAGDCVEYIAHASPTRHLYRLRYDVCPDGTMPMSYHYVGVVEEAKK